MGEFIVQGEVLAVIESSTGVHYKYVPFSGVVIAINQEVISDPGFLDQFHSWVAPDEEGNIYFLDQTFFQKMKKRKIPKHGNSRRN